MESNSPTAVLIGNSCRSLAWSAHRAGLQVVACDDFHDRDLLDVAVAVGRDSLETVARDYPRAYFLAAGGCEHQHDTLQMWARQGEWQWLGVQADAFPHFRDPDVERLASLVAGCGFPTSYRIPAGTSLHGPDQWSYRKTRGGEQAEPGNPGWLIKPRQSGGGHGIEWFFPELHGQVRPYDVVIQKYCPGRSLSIVYWGSQTSCRAYPPMESLTSQHRWHGLISAPTPFTYSGNLGPVEVSHRVQQQLDTWGSALHSLHPWQGWLQTDWIIDEQDFCWLLEINPRWSQSMELLESMSDHVASTRMSPRSWVGSLLNNEPPPPISGESGRPGVGKLILYAEHDLTVSENAGEWMWERRWNRKSQLHLRCLEAPVCADIPVIGTRIPQGAPICSVLVALEREGMLSDFVTKLRMLLLS